ncbi:hypothetical protein FACS1894187_06220 [Synergistales bacterium]|nr:hypothetical protein FACS1894187_06220 [Synergistales bacterium]
MAVHYTGGGGGLLGTILGTAGMLVPGLQPFAPFLGAAGALMNGNPGGALQSAAGGMMGNTPAQRQNPMLAAAQGTSVGQPVNRPPNYNSDPATGLMPMYQSGDMTDSIAREQGGKLPDYWKYFGQRRKV